MKERNRLGNVCVSGAASQAPCGSLPPSSLAPCEPWLARLCGGWARSWVRGPCVRRSWAGRALGLAAAGASRPIVAPTAARLPHIGELQQVVGHTTVLGRVAHLAAIWRSLSGPMRSMRPCCNYLQRRARNRSPDRHKAGWVFGPNGRFCTVQSFAPPWRMTAPAALLSPVSQGWPTAEVRNVEHAPSSSCGSYLAAPKDHCRDLRRYGNPG